jgi:hypothetical protein
MINRMDTPGSVSMVRDVTRQVRLPDSLTVRYRKLYSSTEFRPEILTERLTQDNRGARFYVVKVEGPVQTKDGTDHKTRRAFRRWETPLGQWEAILDDEPEIVRYVIGPEYLSTMQPDVVPTHLLDTTEHPATEAEDFEPATSRPATVRCDGCGKIRQIFTTCCGYAPDDGGL